MGKICMICGDRGWSNAFIYCVKCLKLVIHRYCLDVIPETFDEYVRWVCDDCESNTKPCSTKLPISCDGSSKGPKEETFLSFKEKTDRTRSCQILKETELIDLENQCSDPSTNEIREEIPVAPYSTANNCQEFANDSMRDWNPCAQPLIDTVWRGSFDIWNQNHDILDGLMAHMSIKACHKAYEEACQFQPVLRFEMVPMSDIWPKSFQTSEPNGENIAMYFLPSETSERAFDHLVDKMVHKELAMRGYVQNAELLLFPSTDLPILYWRFRGKYYLWGVFKGKQRAPSTTHSETEELRDKNTMHADVAVKVKVLWD